MSMTYVFRNTMAAFLLAMADLLAIGLAFNGAYGLRLLLNEVVSVRFGTPYGFYIRMWWIPAIILLVMAYLGLYTRRAPYWDEVGRILRAIFLATALVLASLTLLKLSERFSRLFLVLFAGLLCGILPLVRLWGKRLLVRLGLWRQPVLIFGKGPLSDRVASVLGSDPYLGYEVAGTYQPGDGSGDASAEDGPAPGEWERTDPERDMVRGAVLAVAQETMDDDRFVRTMARLVARFPQLLVVPSSVHLPVLNVEPLHLFHQHMLILRVHNNLVNPVSRVVKRLFDLAGVLLFLPLTIPVGLVIAMLLKLDSPGPVFIRQERTGYRGRSFRFFKFRTMHVNNEEILDEYLASHPAAREEWDRYKKLRGFDPRVTRVGRFLRRTSLDELPQLWNVLAGSMSLVGPRPYLPRERTDMEDHYPLIVRAKPGLTGLWQISGRNELTFEDRLRLDRWYVTNWTLWLDVEILIKTIGVVMKRKGAY